MTHKIKIFAVGVMAAILISGCGQSNENNSSGKDEQNPDEVTLEPIEVEIEMDDQADPDEKVTISAEVTQGEAPVTDANEVLFEIWKDGQKDESIEVEADQIVNDKYEITHLFEREGVYHVTAHVTARNMHRMPTEEITIGDIEEAESVDEGEHPGHDGHSHSAAKAELHTNEEFVSGTTVDLPFQVTYEGESLREADVQLEIWQNGEDDRAWRDAEETDAGIYTASHTFDEAGEYHVVVHMKDDNGLHEHVEKKLQVN